MLLTTLACTLPLLVGDEESARVDALFARWDRPGSPGASCVVAVDGEVVHAAGYGEASIELGVPIEPGTVFYLGSVSKQLVAACVALLEADGALSLDDDVREYVPELPDYGAPITLRHLVHHTSGLRDYLSLYDLAGRDIGSVHQDQPIVDLIARQEGLNFASGTRYSYSNSGYFLLNVVVARVTGTSLRAFAEERLFGPLGMTSARFHDDYTVPIPKRAFGHMPGSADEFRLLLSTFDRVGSGGVYADALDLVTWANELDTGAVLGEAFAARLLERGVLDDGTELDYAFGLRHGEHRGLATVEHGGALGGYRTALVRFPEHRVTVVVLANLSSMQPSSLARAAAEVWLEDHLAPAGPTDAAEPAAARRPPPYEAGDAELDALVGAWHARELGATYDVVRDGARLRATIRGTGRPLPPLAFVGHDRLHAGWGDVRVVRDEDGAIAALELSRARASGIRLRPPGAD